MRDLPIIAFTAGLGIMLLSDRVEQYAKLDGRKFGDDPLWYRALVIVGVLAPLASSIYEMESSPVTGGCMFLIYGFFVIMLTKRPAPKA